MNECIFGRGKKCAILNVPSCPKHCKFRKTEIEFYAAQEAAVEMLKKKGLRPAMIQGDNGYIMSVEEDR